MKNLQTFLRSFMYYVGSDDKIHLQSTICSVQQVTEAAMAVLGQEAWALIP